MHNVIDNCPFCDGEARIEEVDNAGDIRKTVGCRDEDCMGYQSLTTFATRREAIKAWNTRPQNKANEVIDKLVKRANAWQRADRISCAGDEHHAEVVSLIYDMQRALNTQQSMYDKLVKALESIKSQSGEGCGNHLRERKRIINLWATEALAEVEKFRKG